MMKWLLWSILDRLCSCWSEVVILYGAGLVAASSSSFSSLERTWSMGSVLEHLEQVHWWGAEGSRSPEQDGEQGSPLVFVPNSVGSWTYLG